MNSENFVLTKIDGLSQIDFKNFVSSWYIYWYSNLWCWFQMLKQWKF